MRAWLEDVAHATGGEAWTSGGVACAWQPVPERALSLLFPPPDAAALDAALHRGAELGARIAGCWAAAPDAALGAVLEERGFERGWDPHWMALHLARALPAPPSAVAEATSVPEWDDYGRSLLGMAAARAFVARVDGELAGFCWLHESGGLFDLVVFPAFRRRGLGAALTLAAARAAQADGHRWLVLNATRDGAALYATLGFTTLGYGATWWRHGRAAPPTPPGGRRARR